MKDENELKLMQKALLEGDEWLREHGAVTDMTHNTIVANIYVLYPEVKYADYLLDPDLKIIDLRVFVGTWKLFLMTILGRRDKFLSELFFLTQDYLKEFEIRITLKRYKDGVEKAKVLKTQAESELDTTQQS
jgi:hypothetical protein